MKITEQAVKEATEQLNISDMTLYDSYTKGQEAMVRRMLAAAAPYMSGVPARDQALEEAVRDACMYLEIGFIECPRCGEEVETKNTDAEYTLRLALKSQPSQTGWLPIKEEPDNTKGPFLVTNNAKALNAFDRPSHVWCVSEIYTDDDGSFCAFEGSQKLHGLTMYMHVVAPQTGGGDADA